MSTTNGTRAIVTAAERCDRVLIASLLNLEAVVGAARAHGDEVAVFCAGVKGAFALDDAYVAGRVAEGLGWREERRGRSRGAARVARTRRAEEAFRQSRSGRNLINNGPELEADIPYCARESVLDVVPRLTGMHGVAAEIAARVVIVNRDERRGRATSFAAVADAYERARPEYPADAVRWLTGDEPADVVDLGAGTGKLTRGLVALGHRVTAVEPLPEMLEHLRRAVPAATAVTGSAEQIPLPDGSADVVACAQAFHWFDQQAALREIARVLRPGGRIALVWNTRDDREPWTAR